MPVINYRCKLFVLQQCMREAKDMLKEERRKGENFLVNPERVQRLLSWIGEKNSTQGKLGEKDRKYRSDLRLIDSI